MNNSPGTLLDGLDPDYFFLRMSNPEDPRLMLVFSARTTVPGTFSFFKSFEALGLNVLHVTPPAPLCWYLTGLPGLSDDTDRALVLLGQRLKKWCPAVGISEIVVIGFSMGAHVALRFVLRADAGVPVRVIAMAPEVQPLLPGSFSFKDQPQEPFPELQHEDFSATEVKLIFGEFHLVDSYCALLLKNSPGVSLYSHVACDHFLPQHLNQTVGFVSFLGEFINQRDCFAGRGYLGECLEAEDLKPMLFNPPASDEFLHAVDICIRKYPGFGLGWNRKGVSLNVQKKYPEAIAALKRSLTINPQFKNTLTHLAVARSALARSSKPRK